MSNHFSLDLGQIPKELTLLLDIIKMENDKNIQIKTVR